MKKIKYSQTVLVDIDGVIADFESEFCDRFGYDNREMFNLSARYPEVDKSLIEELVASPYSYENLIPIFGGAVALLSNLRSRGFYTVIMTSRSKELAEVTREWLEGFEIQYNELWFAQNKAVAIQDFNQMYPSRKAFLLIDDCPANLGELPEGVTGVAWEQPWNDGYFPRMRYNSELMRIEVKNDTVSNWVKF